MEPDLKVTFDPPSNRLTLDLTVRDPYRYGMRELPRTRENLAQAKESPLLRFNDVPAPTWYNRTLHLEFYGAKLEGILDIFSGNAFLQDGEKKILQGSLTGDRFDQAYRQLQL